MASDDERQPPPRPSVLQKLGPLVLAFPAAASAALTWVTFGNGQETVALDGIGGNSNSGNADLGGAAATGGWWVIGVAMLLAGVGLISLVGALTSRSAARLTSLLALVLLGVSLGQILVVGRVVHSSAGAGYRSTLGLGVWLAFLTGAAALLLGLLGGRSQETKGRAAGM